MAGSLALDRTEAAALLWLREFGAALERRDAATAAAFFAPDGWWRDLLALTWDLRTFHGASAITAALGTALASMAPRRFELEDGKAPVLVEDPSSRWIHSN
jgi:hypothetical protein